MENNNSTANHFMDEKENGGLCDETLNIFRQFIAMATVTSMHPGVDLECSICLNIIFRPHLLEGCNHIFGEVCLIRLFEASKDTVSGPSCPLCRAAIQRTTLIKELDETLMNYYEEECHNRMEMETEVYHLLSPHPFLMDLDFRKDFAGFGILNCGLRNGLRLWFIQVEVVDL
jgi:hypothetical protein